MKTTKTLSFTPEQKSARALSRRLKTLTGEQLTDSNIIPLAAVGVNKKSSDIVGKIRTQCREKKLGWGSYPRSIGGRVATINQIRDLDRDLAIKITLSERKQKSSTAATAAIDIAEIDSWLSRELSKTSAENKKLKLELERLKSQR